MVARTGQGQTQSQRMCEKETRWKKQRGRCVNRLPSNRLHATMLAYSSTHTHARNPIVYRFRDAMFVACICIGIEPWAACCSYMHTVRCTLERMDVQERPKAKGWSEKEIAEKCVYVCVWQTPNHYHVWVMAASKRGEKEILWTIKSIWTLLLDRTQHLENVSFLV